MGLTKEQKLEKKRLEQEKAQEQLREFRANLPAILFGYMEKVTKLHDMNDIKITFETNYTSKGMEIVFNFFYNGYEDNETIKTYEVEPWEIAVLDDKIERSIAYDEQLRLEREQARIKEQKRQELLNKLSQEYTQEDLELIGLKLK